MHGKLKLMEWDVIIRYLDMFVVTQSATCSGALGSNRMVS